MIYVLFSIIGVLILETIWAFVFGVSDNLNKAIKITIGSAVVIGACALLTASKTSAPERYTLEETQHALEHTIDKKIPQFDPEDVNAPVMAEAFFEAQNRFEIPSLFLVSIGFYESKYLLNAIGDGGRSIGIMQVGTKGRRRCREYCGDMKTEHEQILCGGCWLRENIDWCKTFERGFMGYVCGRCKSFRTRTKWAVQQRFKLWYVLHDEIRSKPKE